MNLRPTIVDAAAGPGSWGDPRPKVIITAGLRAAWPLIDYDGGSSGQDLSGYNNPLLVPLPGPTDNPPGYSIQNPISGQQGSATFSGASYSRMSRSASGFFDGVADFSLAVWVRLDTASSSQTIAFSFNGTGSYLWWELLFDATINRLKYRFRDGRTGTLKSIQGESIQANQWWLVVVQNDYQNNKAALSAKQSTSSDLTWSKSWTTSAGATIYTPTTNRFRVGWPGSESAYLEGGYLNGKLYSLNIWDRLLAEPEIKWFFQNYRHPWDPDVIPAAEGINYYAKPDVPIDLNVSGTGPVTLTWDNNNSGQFTTEIARSDGSGEGFTRISSMAGKARNSSGSYNDSAGTVANFYKVRHVGTGAPSAWSDAAAVPFPAPVFQISYQNSGDLSFSFTHDSQASAVWGDGYDAEWRIDGSAWNVATGSPWARTTTSGSVSFSTANPAGGELWELRIRAFKGDRKTDWAIASLTSDPF